MLKSTAGTVGEATMELRTRAINVAASGVEPPPRPQPATSDLDYPSARFINGEFRAQTFSDEALLYAMAE